MDIPWTFLQCVQRRQNVENDNHLNVRFRSSWRFFLESTWLVYNTFTNSPIIDMQNLSSGLMTGSHSGGNSNSSLHLIISWRPASFWYCTFTSTAETPTATLVIGRCMAMESYHQRYYYDFCTERITVNDRHSIDRSSITTGRNKNMPFRGRAWCSDGAR